MFKEELSESGDFFSPSAPGAEVEIAPLRSFSLDAIQESPPQFCLADQPDRVIVKSGNRAHFADRIGEEQTVGLGNLSDPGICRAVLDPQTPGKTTEPGGEGSGQRPGVDGRRIEARILDPEDVMRCRLNDVSEFVQEERLIEPPGKRPAVGLAVSKMGRRLILPPGVGRREAVVRKEVKA